MGNQRNNHKYYSNIRKLKDLQRQKNILNAKLRIRKHILNKHINDLNDDFSADYVYRQSLKALKIEDGIMNFIPNLFNFKTGKKSFLISSLTALGAGLTSFFLLKKGKKKKTNSI